MAWFRIVCEVVCEVVCQIVRQPLMPEAALALSMADCSEAT